MAVDLQSEIRIPTPPAAVWRVLTDFDRYHEWNDFVRYIDGRAIRGERVEIVMDVGLSEPNRMKVRLTDVVENETLAWSNKFLFGGFVRTDHYFELYQEAPSETLLIQGMRSSGLLPALINNPLEDTYRIRMKNLNEALRRTAIAQYQGLV